MKLQEIQELIKFVAKSGVNEVEIEQKDFKICIKSEKKSKKDAAPQQMMMPQAMPQYQQQMMPPQQAAPQAPATPAVAPAKEEAVADDSKYVTIKAQMIGTFYRKADPDSPAFVEVGDKIKPGDDICIIEAMKLFNKIEAEISGTIVKVLVDDSTPVEFDQPLFLVDPS